MFWGHGASAVLALWAGYMEWTIFAAISWRQYLWEISVAAKSFSAPRSGSEAVFFVQCFGNELWITGGGCFHRLWGTRAVIRIHGIDWKTKEGCG